MSVRCLSALSVLACCGLSVSVFAQSGQTGPSAGAPSYMIPSDPSSGVKFISIATTLTNQTYLNLDTNQNTYRMVGIPDGLGVYRDEADVANGTFTVLMNHEIGANQGVVRAHGNRGSFVSQWKIRTSDLGVVGARDLTTTANLYNLGTNSFESFTSANPMPQYAQTSSNAQGWNTSNPNRDGFGRFCSGDLAPVSAFSYTSPSGERFGTADRIYLNGEEIGASGRAFAHIATGAEARTTYELPDLADFSWENAVASPYSQRKTIVLGTDDSTPGQVYVYVGDKQATGNTIEKAGLMGGKTYGLSIPGLINTGAGNPESAGVISNAQFNLVDLSASQRGSGSGFQTASNNAGVTNFARPEDIAFNPANPNEFFFVTTGGTVNGVSVPSRLYKGSFSDITNPLAGGSIDMVGQGNNAQSFAGGITSATGATTINSMDNIAVSRFGQVLIQEDVGNNARLGRLWLYDSVADSAVEVGISDSYFFTSGSAGFLTQDEETSGIIDAWDILGAGWWLLDMQAHYALGGELVEGGQLMAVFIPQTVPTPAAMAVLGLGGLVASRRRRV